MEIDLNKMGLKAHIDRVIKESGPETAMTLLMEMHMKGMASLRAALCAEDLVGVAQAAMYVVVAHEGIQFVGKYMVPNEAPTQ